jgi:anti-sigma factor RsiW
LLTCKQFLQELTEFLDDRLDPAVRAELQRHVDECPNCWVVCDTTLKTVRVFKGMQTQPLPSGVQARLWEYLGKHCGCKRKHRSDITEV